MRMETKSVRIGTEELVGEEDADNKSPLLPSSEQEPPRRSALKKKEDIKFVIQSSDPIGQDTAVYTFNEYRMPIDSRKGSKQQSNQTTLTETERALARLVAKISVLLGRSSGRDKVAGTIQYACMFWQWQPFINISGIKDGPEAPWQKLEDSMSSARKVFRLGKWVKEYEKARFALTAPDAMLNMARSRVYALITRILAVAMNTFSCLYYIFDNIVWAAQTNLINRVPRDETDELIGLLKSSSTYEKYVALQKRHKESTKLRADAKRRVERWKDYKNYSSLARLLLAMVHCSLQLKTLYAEQRRLDERYAERIAFARGETSPIPSPTSETSSNAMSADSPTRLERYDSVGSNIAQFRLKDVASLKSEHAERVREVLDAVTEQNQELLASACNLGVLLSRLKFPLFRALPLWVIGVLGVVSNFIGCIKNWPKFVPLPKQTKLAKLRSESYDAEQSGSLPPTPKLA